MLLPALPSASGPFVGPGDRYPNRQLKTKSVPVWLLADSQPHSLHSLKRFFWRRSIVINHFGSKGASPALPSAPPCTEARRGPILARKRWASGIPASTLSSSGAGPNPCSPTTKPEFPKIETAIRIRFRGSSSLGLLSGNSVLAIRYGQGTPIQCAYARSGVPLTIDLPSRPVLIT